MKYCIGVSGGSGNLVSYLAGQSGRNLRFFTDHIHSPDYFGLKSLLKTGDLFGLKYIYVDLTRAIPVRRALAQGCEKLVVILSKNRDFVLKPQGMRGLYRQVCRRYPHIVDAIDRRHTVYNQTMRQVFSLEQKGVAFVFAPSEPLHVGTYSMKEKAERELYDLGLRDFSAQKEALEAFLSH